MKTSIIFGVAFGLNEGYLRGLDIGYTLQSTCQERFNQIFYKWSQVDPEMFPWKSVIQVLQPDTIRTNEVAELVTKHLIGHNNEEDLLYIYILSMHAAYIDVCDYYADQKKISAD